MGLGPPAVRRKRHRTEPDSLGAYAFRADPWGVVEPLLAVVALPRSHHARSGSRRYFVGLLRARNGAFAPFCEPTEPQFEAYSDFSDSFSRQFVNKGNP